MPFLLVVDHCCNGNIIVAVGACVPSPPGEGADFNFYVSVVGARVLFSYQSIVSRRQAARARAGRHSAEGGCGGGFGVVARGRGFQAAFVLYVRYVAQRYFADALAFYHHYVNGSEVVFFCFCFSQASFLSATNALLGLAFGLVWLGLTWLCLC